jgi:hypothetical protein
LANSKSEAVILDCIHGMIGDLIRPEEAEQLIVEGVVLKNMKDYFEMMRDMAHRSLQHSCSKHCLKHTGPHENDLHCRIVCWHLDSSDPT